MTGLWHWLSPPPVGRRAPRCSLQRAGRRYLSVCRRVKKAAAPASMVHTNGSDIAGRANLRIETRAGDTRRPKRLAARGVVVFVAVGSV